MAVSRSLAVTSTTATTTTSVPASFTDDTPRVATLPEEILSNVACRLDSDDLFNLRLTCRDVEGKVLHEFATQLIATKCFIFSSESLKALSFSETHQQRMSGTKVGNGKRMMRARAMTRNFRNCSRWITRLKAPKLPRSLLRHLCHPRMSQSQVAASFTVVQTSKPVVGHSRERGYFICLQGDETRAQIPKLIKEHDIAGEDQLVDPFGMLGAAVTNVNVGGLLGAMPVAAPAAGPAADPNAANPAVAQALQNALTQLGGMLQGAGAATPNAAALFTGPPPAGWGAQGAPIPLGQFFQGLGPNSCVTADPPIGSGVVQEAAATAVQIQNDAGTPMSMSAAQQDDEGDEVVDHGAMDNVE